jgi:hypothetical protein
MNPQRLWLALALAMGAAPAFGAEGGVIRSGEHGDFSRLVFQIEPTTQWSLETGAEGATITFPGKRIDFSTAGVFDLIPRTRITGLEVDSAGGGTSIKIGLGCDCRVSTLFVGARYLAVDVAHRDTPPPVIQPAAEDAEARARRETAVVSSAEEALLRQIERAADQGLISLNGRGIGADGAAEGVALRMAYPDFADTTPPEPPRAEEAPPRPRLPGAVGGRPSGPADTRQIRATTVFDFYSARAADRLTEAANSPECLPDEQLDVRAWSDGSGLFDQLPELRGQLVGEFDEPDATAVRDLARLYIRFGFGAEAETILKTMGAGVAERSLLTDLARTSEGRAASRYGPLGRASACPGRHGLWLALGGAAPAYHDAEHFESVHAAFADLPPDLREHLGPLLVGRLLDDGRTAEARLIEETLARTGHAAGPDLELVRGRLEAAEDAPRQAVARLSALVESNAPNSLEALMHLVDLALEAQYAVPDRTITDLRAALVEHRGSAVEGELHSLLVLALAARFDLGEAVSELRRAPSDFGVEHDVEPVVVRILSEADPEKVGRAEYARTILDAAALVSERPDNDAAREAIAGRLLDLGLPRAAEAMVAPAAGRVESARRLLARAHLDQFQPTSAQQVLDGLTGREAAELRARAHLLQGAFDEAKAELDAAGLGADADHLAWPAGDWPRAREAAGDPVRASMAGYMAMRAADDAPPAPAADPGSLTPEEAFVEPLPRLDRASLGAAQRLLATGRQLEDFVSGLLAPEWGVTR